MITLADSFDADEAHAAPEPVAWIHPAVMDDLKDTRADLVFSDPSGPYEAQMLPLYSAPPQAPQPNLPVFQARESESQPVPPLTEAALETLIVANWGYGQDNFVNVSRAVEREVRRSFGVE